MKTKTSAVVVGGLLTLLLWTIIFVGLNRFFQGRFPSVPVGWLLIGLAALLCPLAGGNVAARLARTLSLRLGALTGVSAGLVVLLAGTLASRLAPNTTLAGIGLAAIGALGGGLGTFLSARP